MDTQHLRAGAVADARAERESALRGIWPLTPLAPQRRSRRGHTHTIEVRMERIACNALLHTRMAVGSEQRGEGEQALRALGHRARLAQAPAHRRHAPRIHRAVRVVENVEPRVPKEARSAVAERRQA
jgi:hypothetical protein